MHLEPGKTYRTTTPIAVCFYEADDCLMTNAINLPAGYELTYVGPDAEDGEIFINNEGTRLCLHDNDLAAIEAK